MVYRVNNVLEYVKTLTIIPYIQVSFICGKKGKSLVHRKYSMLVGLEVVLGEYTLFNMARVPQLNFWVKLNNFCKAGWILSEENK